MAECRAGAKLEEGHCFLCGPIEPLLREGEALCYCGRGTIFCGGDEGPLPGQHEVVRSVKEQYTGVVEELKDRLRAAGPGAQCGGGDEDSTAVFARLGSLLQGGGR